MTKTKKILFVLTSFCVMLLCILGIVLRGEKTPIMATASVFTYTEDVRLQPGVALSNSFLNGKKGYLFETRQNGASVALQNALAGEFSIEFAPATDIVGENDFESLRFDFSSENSNLAFALTFMPVTDSVLLRLNFSNCNNYKDTYVDGSFSNTSDKAVRFSFDPALMTVYNAQGAPIFNLKDSILLKEYLMTTEFPSFENYDVKMTFGGIKTGKTAKVIVFSMCGQRFETETPVNTAGPVFCNFPALNNGVVGTAYTFDKNIVTFDMLDGFTQTFVGDIEVFDESNEKVSLNDSTFTPSKSGTYTAYYTARDSGGMSGARQMCKFYIFAKQPSVAMDFAYPLADITVGKGTSVQFPAITATSALSYHSIPVRAVVLANGETVDTVAQAEHGFIYRFESVGTYKVDFVCTDVNGYEERYTHTVTVSDTAVFEGITFADTYAKDERISLSSAYVSYNGQKVGDVSVLTTFPSGKTTTSKDLVLSEEGQYALAFSYEYNGTPLSITKYFKVRNDNASLWEMQGGLTVESDATAPSYADYAYKGTMLTTTRPVETAYKNVIDISDNTAEDLLCELFVAPSVEGALETSCVDIILTDVHNEENVVDIRLCLDIWRMESQIQSMSILALPQRDYDLETLYEINTTSSAVQNYYYYTSRVQSSFYGKVSNAYGDYPSQSVKLYFDYESGRLYAEMATNTNGEVGKIVVVNLSDENYVGLGNAWKKFTTGETRVSIKISNLTQTAHVLMINLDGQNLSGTYVEDNTPPSIFLDYGGNAENALPVALVDTPYKIFEAYARDLVDGMLTNVGVSIYRKNDDKLFEIESNGGYFTPNEAGEYLFRYSVTDGKGNTETKEITVVAVEVSDVNELQYTFSSAMQSDVFVGETYRLYDGETFGGLGSITMGRKVLFEGKAVEVDENNSFVVDKAGEYTVLVQLHDWVRESAAFEFIITASYSNYPILQEISLPNTIVQGETIDLPTLSAVRYSVSGMENIAVAYSVQYANESVCTPLNSGAFTPDRTGRVLIKVSAGGAERIYPIEVNEAIAGSTKSSYFTSQFIYNDANGILNENNERISVVSESTGLFYNFTQTTNLYVARKIDVNFMSFELAVRQGKGFNKIMFVMTDSVNPSVSVTVSVIKKDDKSSYLQVNGVNYTINGSFTAVGTTFALGFDNATNAITVSGRAVAKVKFADNGNVFHGFTSGEVYLRFRFDDVTGDSVVGVKTIAGSIFGSAVKRDNVGPSVKMFAQIANVEKGDTLIVPKAIAYDFISGVKYVQVRVTSPSNKVLADNLDITQGDLQFEVDEVGIYKVSYFACDGADKITSKNFNVQVLDRQPPTMTLTGEVPQTGSVNESITLPKATIKDNETATEDLHFYIYCVAPDGDIIKVNDYKFTPQQKGLYMVVYFAQDSDGATNTQVFKVRVN